MSSEFQYHIHIHYETFCLFINLPCFGSRSHSGCITGGGLISRVTKKLFSRWCWNILPTPRHSVRVNASRTFLKFHIKTAIDGSYLSLFNMFLSSKNHDEKHVVLNSQHGKPRVVWEPRLIPSRLHEMPVLSTAWQ